MNILVLGSGGREHALAWKISQSSDCDQLYIAPGNAGTSSLGTNIAVDVNNFEEIAKIIEAKNIGLLVVGPEDPLVNGVRDFFESKPEFSKLKIVGPGKDGALLEGSKDFSKQFMERHNIPTAKFATFSSETLEEGINYLKGLNPPYVLKADGLAAGKGVIISESLEEASESLADMLINKRFGTASDQVLIEEYLHGIELSVFVLCDGKNYVILPEAKDYKRIGEDDKGLNTGGMGAISPVPFANEEFLKKVDEQIIQPTVNGLNSDGIDYKGFIFIGLMNVNGNPFVIEYNVRLGDPETQVVIPRIKGDLLKLLLAAANGELEDAQVDFVDKTASTVVMVSGGYPESYEKGDIISGLDKIKQSHVFHAGTKMVNGNVVSNGGRVLAITGLGHDIPEAINLSYSAIENISWKNCYYRRDIGQDLLKLIG